MTERNRIQNHHIGVHPASVAPARTAEFGSRSGGASVDISQLCGSLLPRLALGNTALAERKPRVDIRSPVERFVTLLLDEDDPRTEQRLFEAATNAGDPQGTAERLLGPAARLLGDYWRMDICDFMKVTVAMTRLQRLFWMLTMSAPPRPEPRAGRTILLAPLPEEQHNFGLSIVEDALLRAGWQVDCCGIDENDTFFELLSSNRYAVVGISLGGSALAGRLPSFVKEIRRRSRNTGAGILVGGSILVEKPGLASHAGADFLAVDASSAVRVAEAAVAR
jgi:methanogenic corrinoid protein MtbC1